MEAILVALIVATPPTLVAIAAWYTARTNRRTAEATRIAAERAEASAAESKSAIVRTEDGVHELGKRVDGRLEELLKMTETAARAAGMAAGIAQERADPQSPREREHVAPIEVVGVSDPDAEPIRTVAAPRKPGTT